MTEKENKEKIKRKNKKNWKLVGFQLLGWI